MIRMERIEATMVVGNCKATNFNSRQFDGVVNAMETPHGDPILIRNGEEPNSCQDELDRQLRHVGERTGDTAIVVVGGDGTLQKILQEVYDRELLERTVFIHVPQGEFNMQRGIFGTKPKDVNTALREGQVLPVDLMSVSLEGASYGLQDTRVGVLAVGGNDAIVLKRMEEARGKSGRLTLIEKLLCVIRARKEIQPVAMRVSTKGGVLYDQKTFLTETVNGSPRMFGVEFAKGTIFDGMHTTVLIPGQTREEGIRNMLLTVLNQAFHIRPNSSTVRKISSSEIKIIFSPKAPVHIDAEVEGSDVEAMTIRSQPGAARFFVTARDSVVFIHPPTGPRPF